jgi:hypothetical protein
MTNYDTVYCPRDNVRSCLYGLDKLLIMLKILCSYHEITANDYTRLLNKYFRDK